jgi:hypothetical protein
MNTAVFADCALSHGLPVLETVWCDGMAFTPMFSGTGFGRNAQPNWLHRLVCSQEPKEKNVPIWLACNKTAEEQIFVRQDIGLADR